MGDDRILAGILLRRKIHLQKKGCDIRIGSTEPSTRRIRVCVWVHRTVINRFKNYCFSIQMGVASGFQGLDSVGRDAGNEVTKERRVRKWWRRKGDAEKGRKRVAALLKLLCRSLRSGRSADHLLSSTRKLSDANRFVSGRFKRFTIIRADSNSINASSSPPSCTSTSLPSFCTLYSLTAYKSQYSLSFVSFIHGAWTMRILKYVPRSPDDLELRNVLPNAKQRRSYIEDAM